jgi:hypothetical protein
LSPGVLIHPANLLSADHANFHDAVTHYLSDLPPELRSKVNNAAIAIATPVAGDMVRMTNYPWQFSIEATRAQLSLENLVVVNDFTALAMSLPGLLPHQRRQIGGGEVKSNSVIGLIGAGSGLGVSGLIPAKDGWVALGWQAHPPSLAPADDPPLPPAPAPTPGIAVIEQIHDDQPLAVEGAEPEPDQQLPDYGAMTKAQIIAEVERRYGLALDPGMTKAELVAEAERLTAERLTAGGLPAEAAPIAGFDQSLTADQEPSLPLDLLV